MTLFWKLSLASCHNFTILNATKFSGVQCQISAHQLVQFPTWCAVNATSSHRSHNLSLTRPHPYNNSPLKKTLKSPSNLSLNSSFRVLRLNDTRYPFNEAMDASSKALFAICSLSSITQRLASYVFLRWVSFLASCPRAILTSPRIDTRPCKFR
jgi:hypothetical protein